MNNIQKLEPEIISSLVINGDISKLSQDQKVVYYRMFCERLGLDPLTQPFKLLRLQGKEVLYCDRSGAQQLNKKHNVSHEIKSREKMDDLYVVTCRASIGERFTDSIGAVTITGLKGDALANAMMKGETKAKRRATMDLLGLGMLDETETETIPMSSTQDVFSLEDLRDHYMALLVDYDSLVGPSKAAKLNPDKWKEADQKNTQKFLDGIKYLKEEIQKERDIVNPHLTAHTVDAINEKVRAAADKDDYYERTK